MTQIEPTSFAFSAHSEVKIPSEFYLNIPPALGTVESPLTGRGPAVIHIQTAHGNSLRSIVMDLDKLTPEQVLELNIPTGVPIVYEFDKNLNIVGKKILASQEAAKK